MVKLGQIERNLNSLANHIQVASVILVNISTVILGILSGQAEVHMPIVFRIELYVNRPARWQTFCFVLKV